MHEFDDRTAVDVHHIGFGHHVLVKECTRRAKARSRDQKADAGILRLSENRCNALRLRQVSRYRVYLDRVTRCERVSQLLQQCLAPRHEHEVEARRRQFFCKGTPDAVRRAGDEGGGPEALQQSGLVHSLVLFCQDGKHLPKAASNLGLPLMRKPPVARRRSRETS